MLCNKDKPIFAPCKNKPPIGRAEITYILANPKDMCQDSKQVVVTSEFRKRQQAASVKSFVVFNSSYDDVKGLLGVFDEDVAEDIRGFITTVCSVVQMSVNLTHFKDG